MCSICDDWKFNKIDSKKAFELIGEALKKDPKTQKHLTDLSNKILDKDVPMSDSDDIANEQWTKELYEDKL